MLEEDQAMRLNIGSGQRPFGNDGKGGWLNVDSQEKWHPDIVADGRVWLMGQATGTVEMICLHHVLEHFGCGEADDLLRECHRVLVPGGSLLVFVPDMRKLVQMWRDGELDDQLFLTNVYGAFHGDEHDRHRWGMTDESLVRTIQGAGFERVGLFDGREIPGADIAKDDRWILGVEAWK